MVAGLNYSFLLDLKPFLVCFSNYFFLISQYHCNLSEDFQQSCLTVTINGMLEIDPAIHLQFKSNQLTGCGSSFMRFLDHTQRRTTLGMTPLGEWPARRRDLSLTTTHNTHNRQIPMPPVGFEPTIPAGVRPLTYALDRAAAGTGFQIIQRQMTG